MSNTDTIRKRYDRVAAVYDLMESPMDAMGMAKRRGELWKLAKGKTLEVGVGTGRNMSFYPKGIEVTAIDLSPKMLARARKRAIKEGISVKLVEMDAQNLDFPDNTFDTVVATCVFCSVPDPIQGLKEIARVCKPQGQVLFLEHVRSHKAVLGKVMDLLNPITIGLWGASINRDTVGNIKAADLEIISEQNLSLDIVKKIIAKPM